MRASALRAGIMLLTQDPYFVNGSIRQNLLLHRASGVADDTIVSALERTGLSVKLGLHKGESSVSDILDNLLVPEDMLTRGETQLFAITRAILSTSQILILDEPTSGLDAASDQIVQRVLWEHCTAGNRTMICIAHKLRSIIDYDIVVVVNEGRIVEKGKPSELARTEGSLFGQLLSQSS